MSPAASTASADANLRVTTSPRPGSRVAVEVAVPAGRSQKSYDTALEKLSRSVKLPGFRKGRVPRPVLLQQIGTLRIRATALEDLVDAVVREAMQQEAIEAIGRPVLSEAFELVLERYTPGEELTITLEMDVEPCPSLRSTRGLTAEAEPVPFDPARVDELIEQSRRQLATLVPVEDRTAAEGDVAQIAFSGTFVDSGEAIEGGSSEGMEVELEEGRMIPGFVAGILGMAVGETREVSCRFPDSYPQETAAGREARFSITLLELKTRELPALDDGFAQQASDKSTLAELRADLEERLREEAERRHRSNRHEALLTVLVEQLEVELPETLIQQEVRNLIEQTAGQISQQGMDVKKLFTPDLVRSLMDTSRPEAEQRLRRTLALKALAAAENIEVAAADLEARLSEIRQGLSDSAAIDPERLRLAVAEDLLKETLLEWLEANSTITEKAPDDSEAEAAGAGEQSEATQPAAKTKAKTKKAAAEEGDAGAQEEAAQP
ncbi:trigger factor [Synechococcus sp. CCY 9618]|uniref:trigger factor n=1 Tax=Synechococcus sp. CCY 9618 TaxID=2815602 RepID=UPI001C242993|nr:trigger factor [Synechococcus sp. CCY 9618]